MIFLSVNGLVGITIGVSSSVRFCHTQVGVLVGLFLLQSVSLLIIRPFRVAFMAVVVFGLSVIHAVLLISMMWSSQENYGSLASRAGNLIHTLDILFTVLISIYGALLFGAEKFLVAEKTMRSERDLILSSTSSMMTVDDGSYTVLHSAVSGTDYNLSEAAAPLNSRRQQHGERESDDADYTVGEDEN